MPTNVLYITGIVIAGFLSLILLTKKHKTAGDHILAAWLALTGLHLLAYYLFLIGEHIHYPNLVGIGFSLPLAQGPFLFIYTKVQTSARGFRARYLLHFIPLVLSIGMFGEYFLYSYSEKMEVFKNDGAPFQLQSLINLIALSISGVVYIILSLITLLRYRKQLPENFSNIERIRFNWLLYLIIWLSIIWLIILFIQNDPLIFGAAVCFVLWIGYYGIRQVQVFHTHPTVQRAQSGDVEKPISEEGDSVNSNPKYQNSSLSESEAMAIHQRLFKLLDESALYKDPELTLSDLANMLDVHPNHLSQVINSIEHKSFYDLINERRIAAFLKLLEQPDQQQYTFLALAFSCGFNSKASFNRNFKKITGSTPSEYQKQGLKRE